MGGYMKNLLSLRLLLADKDKEIEGYQIKIKQLENIIDEISDYVENCMDNSKIVDENRIIEIISEGKEIIKGSEK